MEDEDEGKLEETKPTWQLEQGAQQGDGIAEDQAQPTTREKFRRKEKAKQQ